MNLLDERLQVLQVLLARVLLHLLPVAVGDDGGEPCDALLAAQLLVLAVGAGAVHLGHGDGVAVGVRLRQVLPDGRQLLAVAAPRREELDHRHADDLDCVLEVVLVQDEDVGLFLFVHFRFLGLRNAFPHRRHKVAELVNVPENNNSNNNYTVYFEKSS